MSKENDITKSIDEFSKRELGGIKVLMVEDDIFISELVLTKLSKTGCIPYSTADGSEVITLAEQYGPDIIILDLMLPKMDGKDVLIALKEHPELKKIPVIIFSNRSNHDDRQKMLDLGAEAYLVKVATEMQDVIDVIKKLVKNDNK